MINIPTFEYLVFRYLLGPIYFRKMTNEKALNLFVQYSEKALASYEKFPDKNKRIKVMRIPGIEESSTNWSPNLLIEHLAIVNHTFKAIIEGLETNPDFQIEATTESVKPKGLDPNPVETFSRFLIEYPIHFRKINFQSTATQSHPWFGKMTSSSWHKLLALHTMLHSQQISMMLMEHNRPMQRTNIR